MHEFIVESSQQLTVVIAPFAVGGKAGTLQDLAVVASETRATAAAALLHAVRRHAQTRAVSVSHDYRSCDPTTSTCLTV